MDLGRIMQPALSTGLEEVMEFLEQSFPNLEIAIAHGKVIFLYISCKYIATASTHAYIVITQTGLVSPMDY